MIAWLAALVVRIVGAVAVIPLLVRDAAAGRLGRAYRRGCNQGAADRGHLPCDDPHCPRRQS